MTGAMEIILRTEKRGAQGNTATYAIGPLTAGYGMTLGNVLRRVLISSVPGTAVTAIRMTGVHRNDQRIEHIAEDLGEIILNIKQLRLRSFSEQPVSLRLDVRGRREVTAADLVVSPIVEIVNPDLRLATLTNEAAHLSMELVVETGRGYVPVDASATVPQGVIPIDAIYTPVQTVKMAVEKMRVGQMTNYDLLLLTMTTDGTISTDEAFEQSAKILVRYFAVFAEYGASQPEIEQTPLSSVPIPWEIYRIPLENLALSIRTYNRLKRSGLRTVGQVLSLDGEDLRSIRNFGEKSLLELYERLCERHLLPALPDEIMSGEHV
jgi:DNA-directed RNA polymerase subunit alpha